MDVFPGAGDEFRLGGGLGQLFEQLDRRGQFMSGGDIDIRRALHEPATLNEQSGAGQGYGGLNGFNWVEDQSALGEVSNLGKKLAGHLPLSDRPFAFLVTPKLPLGGRRCKSMLLTEQMRGHSSTKVVKNFHENT